MTVFQFSFFPRIKKKKKEEENQSVLCTLLMLSNMIQLKHILPIPRCKMRSPVYLKSMFVILSKQKTHYLETTRRMYVLLFPSFLIVCLFLAHKLLYSALVPYCYMLQLLLENCTKMLTLMLVGKKEKKTFVRLAASYLGKNPIFPSFLPRLVTWSRNARVCQVNFVSKGTALPIILRWIKY